MTEESPIQFRREHLSMLMVLVRAYQGTVHPDARQKGLDERDVAFEAGLLTPMEMELTIYATQKRGRVLRLLREMAEWGWVEMEAVPPQGAYQVFLQPEGVSIAREHFRPWWSKVLDRFRSNG